MHHKLSSLLTQNSRLKLTQKSLNGSINKSQETATIHMLHQQIIRYSEGRGRDPELTKIVDTLTMLSQSIDRMANCELELGLNNRQLLKQQNLMSELEQRYATLQLKHDDIQKQHKNLLHKIDDLQHQNSSSYHQMQLQQKLNGDLNTKVVSLEQRLEIILESDFTNDQVSMRKTLTDLVKETEKQKRDLHLKNQEIGRLQEQLKGAYQKINKLNQKVESMKKKISIKELENLAFDKCGDGENNEQQSDPTQILINNQPYDTLDFRLNSLKLEFADLMNDISEQGTTAFVQKMLQSPAKTMKEQIQLVTSQYTSFKDCAEKFNMCIKYMIHVISLEDLQEQMIYISRNVKHLFMSQNCRLWIMDAQTGVLYTVTDTCTRAIMTKGVFADVLRFQRPMHKRDYTQLCETTTKHAIYTNQTLCYPLFNQNDHLCALLEISDSVSDYYSFDEEYYGVIFAKFMEQVLMKSIKTRLLQVSVNYNSMLNDAFSDLLKSKSELELYKYIRHWMGLILTVSQIAFYFVHDNKLITYSTSGSTTDGVFHKHQNTHGRVTNKQIVFQKQGIAGIVCERKKQLIVMNIKKSMDFDETVDIDTLLPVIVYPIISNNIVIGVFEIPIKQRSLIKVEKDKIMLSSSNIAGLDQSFEMMVEKVSNVVLNAIQILKL